MILVLEGQRYQGSEALTVLGSLTTGTDWFNRLSRWLGSSSERARSSIHGSAASVRRVFGSAASPVSGDDRTGH